MTFSLLGLPVHPTSQSRSVLGSFTRSFPCPKAPPLLSLLLFLLILQDTENKYENTCMRFFNQR